MRKISPHRPFLRPILGTDSSIDVVDNAGGVTLESTGASVTVNGTISGSGFFGHGVFALGANGNSVTINEKGSVATTGPDARAIDLQASNSEIILAGTVSNLGGSLINSDSSWADLA